MAIIGIKDSSREAITRDLSALLADEFLLYVKTRNAHWNVEGSDFHAAHTFFEDQYRVLDEIIDDVAERIRTLGHYAPATFRQYLALTKLSEASRSSNSSQGFYQELLQDHEHIIQFLRRNIKRFASDLEDIGTSDFITAVMSRHEKMAWMIRAHCLLLDNVRPIA